MPSSMDLIKKRGEQLEEQFIKSRVLNFHDKYVQGDKLGEGQHASVYKCFERLTPRDGESTPLLAKFLHLADYSEKTMAVKIVRDDD